MHMRKHILIVFVGLALILSAEYLGFSEGMHTYCYDLFFRLRGPVEKDSRILIAAIDENTLRRLGRWPINRSNYATLLDRLDKAGAVGFNVLLAEPTQDDAALENAIRKHGRVVLPTYVRQPHTMMPPLPQPVITSPYTGHAHLEQDIDGVVRESFHTIYADGLAIPSFSSVLFEILTHKTFLSNAPPQGTESPKSPPDIIQQDARRINYHGPPGTYPFVSMIDIIDQKFPPDYFSNRVILVGITAEGLEGGALTPFSQLRRPMNGVEVHANILDSLLNHNEITSVPVPVRTAISIGLALLGLFVMFRARSRHMVLWWFVCMTSCLLASFGLFAYFNIWFSPILFSVSLSFMFIMAHVFKLEQTGQELRDARDEWEDSFNSITDAIVLVDGKGHTIRMNRCAETMQAPRLLQLLTQQPKLLLEKTDRSDHMRAVTEEVEDSLSGTLFEITSFSRFGKDHEHIGIIHVIRDISERRKIEKEKEQLQSQFLQAQKMESIGRLVGGVAHDFNNILTVMLGYSELAMRNISNEASLKKNIAAIYDSCLKASSLTRQLLIFSRKNEIRMQVVNIKFLIENMAGFLSRIIGENVKLRLNTEEPVENVMADNGYIEQVIMNLAVNARDAMPNGGTLTIETANVTLDAAYARRHPNVTPGPYVLFSMSDSGIGMSQEVQSRIFEPFFTTKSAGEGTGLGLATVYGIINRMSGHIFLYSEPGKGTVFKIYLPAHEQTTMERSEPKAVEIPVGTETILIAEDEISIRQLLVELLPSLGYTVLTAASGQEALEILEQPGISVDVLLADVVMPGMGGKELETRFLQKFPDAKVLFMSGYTEDVIAQHGLVHQEIAFIQKPLQPSQLAVKLREVLDGCKPSP